MHNPILIETNLNQLVRIKIRDSELQNHVHYHPAQKRGWWSAKIDPEYFYRYSCSYTRKEAEAIWIIDENNNAFDYPRVVLWFSDGKDPITYKFKTYENALKFFIIVKEKCNMIGNVHLSDLDKLSE